MRRDALGLFWADEPKAAKVKKEKVKCTPPPRVWESPDYLPGLKEALEFNISLMSMEEIVAAVATQDEFIFDTECNPNYWLIAFTSYKTGRVIYAEMDEHNPLNIGLVKYIVENLCIVGFNSYGYDLVMCAMALAGYDTETLKFVNDQIIIYQQRPSDILKSYKVKALKNINHIDLIEVAPLRANLKIYGGRLHTPQMQDLPFNPDTWLTDEQKAIVRWYCIKDLTATAFLRVALKEPLELRNRLSIEYRMDLRSKSDAQIAEAVMTQEMTRVNGHRPQKPMIAVGTSYNYKTPSFIKFQTPLMNKVLNLIQRSPFVVGESGSITMPPELNALQITIGDSVYRMGIGGLHSSEKGAAHFSDDRTILRDYDVTSYYPFIILLLSLYPQHLGPGFLDAYRNLVYRRIAAKRAGNKSDADSLKITINGIFGKLGNMYSIFYSPDLLIQVTVTGQLSLLMMIERMELEGLRVVSANTDGIVIKCPKAREQVMKHIVEQWQKDTGFELEDNDYKALLSRDVNNYIAVKYPSTKVPEITVKTKGAYSRAGMSKNPTNEICIDAIEAYLCKGTPIEQTVRSCKDIRKFVSVRTVKGGAVKLWGDNNIIDFLGKAIRWYYATGVEGTIVYAKSGNKVPKSDGAKPLMDLPSEFPNDVDFEWYIEEAVKMLNATGYEYRLLLTS